MTRNRNGAIAMNTLRHECEDAIKDIDRTDDKLKSLGSFKKCPDPTIPMALVDTARVRAKGISVLLRFKLAELDYAVDMEKEMKKTVAKVTGLICVTGGIIYALLDNLGIIIGLFR